DVRQRVKRQRNLRCDRDRLKDCGVANAYSLLALDRRTLGIGGLAFSAVHSRGLRRLRRQPLKTVAALQFSLIPNEGLVAELPNGVITKSPDRMKVTNLPG